MTHDQQIDTYVSAPADHLQHTPPRRTSVVTDRRGDGCAGVSTIGGDDLAQLWSSSCRCSSLAVTRRARRASTRTRCEINTVGFASVKDGMRRIDKLPTPPITTTRRPTGGYNKFRRGLDRLGGPDAALKLRQVRCVGSDERSTTGNAYDLTTSFGAVRGFLAIRLAADERGHPRSFGASLVRCGAWRRGLPYLKHANGYRRRSKTLRPSRKVVTRSSGSAA